MLAPPKPPAQDDPELLIPEARARQRRRWLIVAAIVAAAGGLILGLQAVLAGRSISGDRSSSSSAATRSARHCRPTRVVGNQIFFGNRIVYRASGGGYSNPRPIPRHQVQCSGATVWVVFNDGSAMNQGNYLGVRSGNGGRSWRTVFSGTYIPVKAPHHLVAGYLGLWTLAGPDAAYFVGDCVACGYGTNGLWVTQDGGRTFRHYAIPSVTGYGIARMTVSSGRVTLLANRIHAPKGPARESVTVRVS